MSKDKRITLSVKNVSVGYKNTVVAKDINFEISRGELMSIIGINGVGKSTLLRTLANIHAKLAGSILINEEAIENYNAFELSTLVSVVLTEPIASKNLTVQELVALGRQPYTNWIGKLSRTDISKITEAIRLLELENLTHKKCYQLSDGQLQRVLIARAIAQDTSIILLDEPTTHLDLYHKVQLLKLLKFIAKQTNKAVLFTSHEIEMAIQLCDKMLLLNPPKHYFGSPKKLIAAKAFEQLFPTEVVSFDAQTASFHIEK